MHFSLFYTLKHTSPSEIICGAIAECTLGASPKLSPQPGWPLDRPLGRRQVYLKRDRDHQPPNSPRLVVRRRQRRAARAEGALVFAFLASGQGQRQYQDQTGHKARLSLFRRRLASKSRLR